MRPEVKKLRTPKIKPLSCLLVLIGFTLGLPAGQCSQRNKDRAREYFVAPKEVKPTWCRRGFTPKTCQPIEEVLDRRD